MKEVAIIWEFVNVSNTMSEFLYLDADSTFPQRYSNILSSLDIIVVICYKITTTKGTCTSLLVQPPKVHVQVYWYNHQRYMYKFIGA